MHLRNVCPWSSSSFIQLVLIHGSRIVFLLIRRICIQTSPLLRVCSSTTLCIHRKPILAYSNGFVVYEAENPFVLFSHVYIAWYILPYLCRLLWIYVSLQTNRQTSLTTSCFWEIHSIFEL